MQKGCRGRLAALVPGNGVEGEVREGCVTFFPFLILKEKPLGAFKRQVRDAFPKQERGIERLSPVKEEKAE